MADSVADFFGDQHRAEAFHPFLVHLLVQRLAGLFLLVVGVCAERSFDAAAHHRQAFAFLDQKRRDG